MYYLVMLVLGLAILAFLLAVLFPIDMYFFKKKMNAWVDDDPFWLDKAEANGLSGWMTQPLSGLAMALYDLIHRRKP